MKIKSFVLFVGAAIALSPCSHAQTAFTDANWIRLGTGGFEDGAISIAASAGAQSIFAGGVFQVGAWNGTNWLMLPAFGLAGLYNTLAADQSGILYLAGVFVLPNETRDIAKWNGTNWLPVGGGLVHTANSGLMGAGSLAIDRSGNLFAGGSFYVNGNQSISNIAMWDGKSWTSLGAGLNGVVFSLGFDAAGYLYAGGAFTNSVGGGSVAMNIARWDGANWNALGNGIAITTNAFGGYGVSALAADGAANIYAAGSFTNAGAIAVNNIARWDGFSWSSLGTGLNGNVSALRFDRAGMLYAGGRFTVAGGNSATNIARWDGTNWSALGSGVNGQVKALSYDGNGHLFVGGSYSRAGTNYFPGITEAIIGVATNAPVLAITNASAGNVELSWPLDHTGWRLQAQRNAPGVGITSNWFTIAGSTNVNATNFPVNPGTGSVFYRLVYP